MVLIATSPATGLYGVEVSGWDTGENFFVEKTQLEWDEGAGKRVRLSRPLRKSCIVFVRLLQPLSPSHGYPIAYQAEPSGPPVEASSYEYKLVRLHPRISPRREPVA